MMIRSLVWLRDDLRLADNPALAAAVEAGGSVAVLHVHEEAAGLRPLGGAARWWLERSLASLGTGLKAAGVELLVETGDPRTIVPETVQRLGAGNVFWNRRYAPAARAVDAAIKAALRERGVAAVSHPGNVLAEPWTIRTGSGGAFRVFTPFARAVRQSPVAIPLPAPFGAPAELAAPSDAGQRGWMRKLEGHWSVGEAAARAALLRFLDEALDRYAEDRDRPSISGTSVLSPHLRFGEISARQVWHAAQAAALDEPARGAAVEKFLSELIWRDFNHHQLHHRPDIAAVDMRDTFAGLEWRDDPPAFTAWTRGLTGIPVVDAGMRQLWETGWMHNRVRMLVASFLTKNLLLDWRLGERWFWDTLVDADAANNPGNWQWVAGCGMDAAPYFRIFNPLLQAARFDPDGAYVRRWVPELAGLPDAWVHRPFEAPESVLAGAGVVLGRTYPRPIADIRASQRRARETFARL